MTDDGASPTSVRAEVISTLRLDLLPLRIEHAAEMAEVLKDPALHAFTGGTPYAPEALLARYERLVAGAPDPAVRWLNWVIHLRPEERLAGTVQATVADRTAEIAWAVGTPWQGRGIAGEAARGLVTWLRTRPVDAVIAHVHPDHHASAAVARSAGLTATDEQHDGEIRWLLRL
ncbi:GNAT family N-acetyltransferase [Lentzea aerocolonigenes]|uniref:GNAT family N-acetyltransferase n=1 Tax=Lentzea aerocolonigenes TaxID=68170 RepID=UPI000567C10B|nr:GNAT family N-acetyltransferase [Lentzea aerocolonigenes]MCP2248789.1 Protein N-acetyltransferase, RimJ/RimL family [Lentzea aerocolonigenes]